MPVRSSSLPAKKAHSGAASISEALDNIRFLSSIPACTTTAAAASLAGLSTLCAAVDELLRLPTTQRAVARNGSSGGAELVEEALHGYVQLLDSCTAAKDALLLTKEHATAVDSALRRRGADAAAVLRHVEEYVWNRKKTRKAVAGSLKQLKPKLRSEHRHDYAGGEGDRDALVPAGTLGEVWAAAASVLGHLLRFVSPVPTQNNGKRWRLLIPNVFPKGSSTGSKQQQEGQLVNDVELADAAVAQLQSQLLSGKVGGSLDVVHIAQMRLKALEALVDRLESAIDEVYKGLIRNKVTLLNIISP